MDSKKTPPSISFRPVKEKQHQVAPKSPTSHSKKTDHVLLFPSALHYLGRQITVLPKEKTASGRSEEPIQPPKENFDDCYFLVAVRKLPKSRKRKTR